SAASASSAGLSCITSQARRIAFLAYYFPPIGGGGTPRSVKFVKYLHRFGYEPTVVTVEPETHAVSREFQFDASSLSDLSDSRYSVVRVANPDATGLRKRLRQSRYFPLLWAAGYRWLYEARPWAFAAQREIARLHEAEPFDAIYASSGPASTLEAAAAASKQHGIPWVADLRDLWTRDSLKFYPSAWHYRWESRLEKRVLTSAAAIVANTPLSGDRLRDWLGPAIAKRVTVIPNGYDSAEFPDGFERSDQAADGTITIVYAGTLYDPGQTRSRLGRYRPYELANDARSLKPVVEGMRVLRSADAATSRRIRVRILGHVPHGSRRLIDETQFGDQIVCEGCLPRSEAIAATKSAEALLILQVAFRDPEKPVPYVPGKVYDYLAAGSPILAPVAPGDLRDLLLQTPQAYVCDYRYAETIAASLQRLVADLDRGTARRCESEWLSQFDRVNLTQNLVTVFDTFLGRPAEINCPTGAVG
ncbi:MAG: glycosyltransferase, partial [Bryobacteraceae bacterium]|nr:glycosyltransferase [Bryobacteraceae bacterium]